jgi:glycosyltransferase involved in cell wall biosynthesis
MRIGVDATCWQNQRGYGRHARALLKSLVQITPNDLYVFFTDSPDGIADIPDGVEVRLVQASLPASEAASATSHRSLMDMWQMSRGMSVPGFDILLFPTVYTYVPVFSSAKKVIVIHDAIPEVYPELTMPARQGRYFWQLKSMVARRQADAIVTVSEYSRKVLARQFNIPPEKLFVVGEASDPVFHVLDGACRTETLRAKGVPNSGRLIAYLGGFGPHKNILALVKSFSQLAGLPEYDDIYLVMVGEYRNETFHSQIAEIQAEIQRAGISHRVIFTGYLPDEELVVLLNRATVLVLPSLMEGFGLPAIEAAACGCPVIATRESPLPELLGEGGIYINPTDPFELTSALQQVLDSRDLRQAMRVKGLEAARQLTWEHAARQMTEVLSGLVQGLTYKTSGNYP